MAAAHKRVYLDYASFTPVKKTVEREIERVLRAQITGQIGNPVSIHKEGRGGKDIVESARVRIARALEVSNRTVVFTSGATEANNIALTGALAYQIHKGKRYCDLHIGISKVEHSSLHRIANAYERLGVGVSRIDVDAKAKVQPEAVKNALRKETVFVSVMHVNSEVGTVEDLRKIGEVIRTFEKENGTEILFHTDAAQSAYYHTVNPSGLGVDALTIDGTKIFGPQGVGALYIGTEAPFAASTGTADIWDIRPGTPAVALIHGFSLACTDAVTHRKKHYAQVESVRDYLIETLKTIPKARIHTIAKPLSDIKKKDMMHLSPHLCNFYFPTTNHEYLAVILDEKGFAVSTKTACSTVEEVDSYTLTALGAGAKTPKEGIRVGLSPFVKKRDITRFVATLKESLPTAPSQ